MADLDPRLMRKLEAFAKRVDESREPVGLDRWLKVAHHDPSAPITLYKAGLVSRERLSRAPGSRVTFSMWRLTANGLVALRRMPAEPFKAIEDCERLLLDLDGISDRERHERTACLQTIRRAIHLLAMRLELGWALLIREVMSWVAYDQVYGEPRVPATTCALHEWLRPWVDAKKLESEVAAWTRLKADIDARTERLVRGAKP